MLSIISMYNNAENKSRIIIAILDIYIGIILYA
jgi:hypothetical protein